MGGDSGSSGAPAFGGARATFGRPETRGPTERPQGQPSAWGLNPQLPPTQATTRSDASRGAPLIPNTSAGSSSFCTSTFAAVMSSFPAAGASPSSFVYSALSSSICSLAFASSTCAIPVSRVRVSVA